jgi:hypothetical protein
MICEKCGAREDTGTVLYRIIDNGTIRCICGLCLFNEVKTAYTIYITNNTKEKELYEE